MAGPEQNILDSLTKAEQEGKVPKGTAAGFAQKYGLPPPILDYTSLEEKRAAADKELLAEQTQANRPTQVTPWGTSTWSQGSDGQWTQTIGLDPQAQQSLDAQQALGLGRSQLAGNLLGQARENYGSEMNWGALPQAPDAQGARDQAINAAYSQATSRLDPRFQQDEESLRTRLYNQGLREGDVGFDRQMQQFGQTKNDAYQGAMNSAIGQGTGAMQALFGMGQSQHQQALSDMMTQRNQPLNEMNALLSGQQVQSPDMPGFSQAGRASAPDYIGAAGMQYQAGMDAYNANQAEQYMNDPMRQLLGLGQTAFNGYLGYMGAKNPYGW